MEIIIVSKLRGGIRRLQFGTIPLIILVAVLLSTGLGTGIYLGGLTVLRGDPAASKDQTEAALQQALLKQRQRVDELAKNAETDLNALAARLGRLQADMMRINALGARLSEMAGIPPDEFIFDSPPPLGGAYEPGTRSAVKFKDFISSLDRLTDELSDKEEMLYAMQTLMSHKSLQSRIVPTGKPVKGGWVSSRFGTRTSPVDGRREFHPGVDFTGAVGVNVLAVATGVVIRANRHSGYGNVVEIDHGNGFVTRYAHNSKNLVTVGQKVEKGSVIALMGSTGRSTGPHVHLEVIKDGTVVDPLPYIYASATSKVW